jgi:hypothetical protein
MQAPLPVPAGKQGGRRQQLSPLPSAATAADGCPCLHPTTKLVLLECTTIHTFSGQAKLCFIRDEKSNKDFFVDTGATLSLVPCQSAAAATGPKLQAVNKQAIKRWNFVNTAVRFNGQEYMFAFPIVGLDFLRFFGMQRNPSSPMILIAPSTRFQGGGTAVDGGPPFLFFGPERGPSASAECCRRCSPYSS